MYVGVEPSGLVCSKVINAFSMSGCAASIASGRLSYALGLIGPCYSVDTACSSALAALHVSASAIRLSECDSTLGIGTKFLTEALNQANSIAGMTSL